MSLSDKAYHAVRDEILRGQLRPGTPLSRRRLARQLGMSVLPVTDALRRLEGDGLVESRARAVLRRGVSRWVVDWDGTVHLAPQ